MMIRIQFCRKAAALLTSMLLAAGSAQSLEHQNDANSIATRSLIERTGITVQMHSLQEMVDESSQVHAARCGSAGYSDDIPGFNAESVIFDTLSAFNKNHTRSIEPIESWYQSPLAKKIKIAEEEPINQSSLTKFQRSTHFRNPYRKKLLNSIVDNLQIPRFVAIMGTEVEYAGILQSGCIKHAETTAQARREQTLADITREDKNLTAMLVRGDIVVDTAYLFRNLSDEELAEYEAFTSSEAGQFFYAKLIDATQESLQRAGDRLSNSLRSDLHGSIDF